MEAREYSKPNSPGKFKLVCCCPECTKMPSCPLPLIKGRLEAMEASHTITDIHPALNTASSPTQSSHAKTSFYSLTIVKYSVYKYNFNIGAKAKYLRAEWQNGVDLVYKCPICYSIAFRICSPVFHSMWRTLVLLYFIFLFVINYVWLCDIFSGNVWNTSE